MDGQIDETLVAKANASIEAEAEGVNFPASYWQTSTNMQAGFTWITVPGPGNLWVYYGWSQAPAQTIYVWHQGGSTTPISQGENNIQVGPGDLIIYALASPGTDMIKLAYQLT